MAKRPPTAAARVKAPKHFVSRLRALQERIASSRADALLISNRRDIRYLTGFVGDDSWLLVKPSAPAPTVISDFRFAEQIAREAPHVAVVMRQKKFSEELVPLCRKLRIVRLGLQADHTTLAQRKSLAKALGAKNLVELEDDLLKQRAIKDVGEVALIRKSLKIQQKAYRKTLGHFETGQTEAEVAAYLEYQMRLLGADGVSFPPIVAAGANSSLPHAIPGPEKIRKHTVLLIDWGSRYGGYCSDLTRTIGIGKMPKKIKEIYRIVLDAQLAAIDAIAPGVRLADVDQVARDIIDKAGYKEQFGHSLGHGIGLDIHEEPRLSHLSEGVLEVGHIVTVEPGIYLPGVGGVRIEDDVLVTDEGHDVLSDLPKDLESAII